MRPIDADALSKILKTIANEYKEMGETLREKAVICAVKCLESEDVSPTLDYAPVVHGEWVRDINNLYGCSECLGRETMSHKALKRFCPNCGAKMDGGENNG